MTNFCDLPRLEVLAVEDLVLHEFHDGQRTPPLIEKLKSSGVLRNPVIVIPTPGAERRYVVLDGANRYSAFRREKIPHIVAQVVGVDDPGLALSAWNHVLWGPSPEALLCELEQVPGVSFQVCESQQASTHSSFQRSLLSIFLPDGRMFTAYAEDEGLGERLECLNAVFECYHAQAQIDRIAATDIQPLIDLYPDLSGLVIFPEFQVEEILKLAESGHLVPPGCTRFTISPRVLHINYPLDELMDENATERKNQDLQRWLQGCCAEKGFRFYAESTILFDE